MKLSLVLTAPLLALPLVFAIACSSDPEVSDGGSDATTDAKADSTPDSETDGGSKDDAATETDAGHSDADASDGDAG
jgi:hypothetical protein